MLYLDIAVWLITSPKLADINRFRSHTGKILHFSSLMLTKFHVIFSNRKERVKKEAKQREIESARRNGQLATATTAKQQQQSLINVQEKIHYHL